MCIRWISFVLPEIHQPGCCNVWWLQAIEDKIESAELAASVGSLLAWLGQHNVSSARLGSVACRKLCQKAAEARGCASRQGCALRHLDAAGDMKLVAVKTRKVIGAPASNREGKLKHLGSHQAVKRFHSSSTSISKILPEVHCVQEGKKHHPWSKDPPWKKKTDSPQLMLVEFPESYVFVGEIPMFVGQIQGFSLVNPRVAFLNHT